MLSILAGSLLLGATLLVFLCTVVLTYRKGLKQLVGDTTDEFISARKTQSWFGIGLSLYAGAVGMWSLNTPPETAATDGGWALLGYAIACGFPWLAFYWPATRLRRLMSHRGFTALDFIKERYGVSMHLVATFISVIYLLFNLTSELTAVGGAFTALLPRFPPLAATLSIAVVTNIYSAVGGLPASMFTDRIQAIATVILVILSYSAMFVAVLNKADTAAWQHANYWPSRGLMTAAVLIFSCIIVEQVNQATWQRVFAAKTERDMLWGFAFGVSLMFPSMIIFGLPGIFARAADYAGFIHLDPSAAYQSVFLLLSELPDVWGAVVIILAVGIVASTVDTIQAGLAAMISGELSKRKIPLYWARVFSLLLNIPAIIVASFNPPSVLELLVLGSTFGVAMVPVLWLGFTSHATAASSVAGVGIGLFSIFLSGVAFTGSFQGGLTWGTFPSGYDWRCLITFFVIVFASTAITYLVAQIEFWLDPSKQQKQLVILNSILSRDISKLEEPTKDASSLA